MLLGPGLCELVSPHTNEMVTQPMEAANANGVFTDRLNLKVRPEMRQDIERIAAATELTTSDVARWILAVGIETFTDKLKGAPANGEV